MSDHFVGGDYGNIVVLEMSHDLFMTLDAENQQKWFH
jgi:hypothetical protein